jgi:hypothetical protein
MIRSIPRHDGYKDQLYPAFKDLPRFCKYRFSLLLLSRRQVYTVTTMLVYALSTFSFFFVTDLHRWIGPMTLPGITLVRNVRNVKTCCFNGTSPIKCGEPFGYVRSLDRLDIYILQTESHRKKWIKKDRSCLNSFAAHVHVKDARPYQD